MRCEDKLRSIACPGGIVPGRLKDFDDVAHNQGMQACVQFIDGNYASQLKSLQQGNKTVEKLHRPIRFCRGRQRNDTMRCFMDEGQGVSVPVAFGYEDIFPYHNVFDVHVCRTQEAADVCFQRSIVADLLQEDVDGWANVSVENKEPREVFFPQGAKLRTVQLHCAGKEQEIALCCVPPGLFGPRRVLPKV